MMAPRSMKRALARAQAAKLQRGVAMLEALIAATILALGLLGAVGMQARAYSVLADASMRAEATMASEKLVSLMTIDQAGLSDYNYSGAGPGSARIAGWLSETKTLIPGAQVVVVVSNNTPTRNQVDVKINWTRKQGSLPSEHRVVAYIASSL